MSFAISSAANATAALNAANAATAIADLATASAQIAHDAAAAAASLSADAAAARRWAGVRLGPGGRPLLCPRAAASSTAGTAAGAATI